MRDITLEGTIYLRFTTRAFATGIPTALAGTPVLSIYEENNLTQITAGVSVSVDYDSVVGLNQATIVATAANGYEAGKSYDLVITTGTVGGVSVIGEVVGSFTIEDSAAGLSAVARANLELMYNTTGYTDDTAPASRAQISGIANTGAAVNVQTIAAPNGFTLTTGSEVGDEDRTHALDGIQHELSDSAGTLDAIYKFDIGGDSAPTSVTFTGVFNSANDSWDISANSGTDGTPVWEQIGTLNGNGGTSTIARNFDMFVGQIVSDLTGIIQIRVNGTGLTTSSFDVDQVFVSKSDTSRSVGYANGAVWIDTAEGTAGIESFVNGVADKPVDLIASAITIAGNNNLHRFEVSADSSITFAATMADYYMNGKGYVIALGGQVCTGSFFIGATVSGTATTVGDEIHFEDCEVGTVTLGGSHLHNCGLTSTITLSEATTYTLQTCHSEIAGSASPTIDFGAALGNTSLNMRRYSGGIEIQNMGATGTDTMSLEGNGALTINANSTGGTIVLRGDFSVTGAAAFVSAGGTITYDDNTTDIKATLADTNELQTDWTNGGRLDLILDIIAADTTTDIPALINGLTDITAAQVLSEVNDALDTAISELGVAAPTSTPTLRTGLMLMYMMARNKVDVDTTGTDAMKVYNDAGTMITSKAITDDGTDYSEAEMS